MPSLPKKLILASQSPRRRELMTRLGLPFEAKTPDFIEVSESTLPPEREVIALARGKARSLAARYPGSWILGCDTLVVLGDRKLGKPADPEEALRMLLDLSGRTHRVLTGLCLLDAPTGQCREVVEESRVKMRSFPDTEARAYVASGEPMDKAGAYGIQGLGAALVDSFQGDYFNVVGLPLQRLAGLLNEAGIQISGDYPCSGSQKLKFSK